MDLLHGWSQCVGFMVLAPQGRSLGKDGEVCFDAANILREVGKKGWRDCEGMRCGPSGKANVGAAGGVRHALVRSGINSFVEGDATMSP